jgi:tetratricopeptide (TPR) repeat protein
MSAAAKRRKKTPITETHTTQHQNPLKIAAVTISANSSLIIADAIRSVIEQVDLVVLVDTGITDDTINKAREIAGQKLRVCKHAWEDFSTARNASLDFAKELGATWAIVVDTDERLLWNGVNLRNACEEARNEVFYVMSADRSYQKEKIFRLSANVKFVGPTHEAPVGGDRDTLPLAIFDELPKTQDQLFTKRTRDITLLTTWVADPENAKDGRWWYYLGDTHQALGNIDEAIKAFAECVKLRVPVSEEGAYAAYRQAECLMISNKLHEAIEACATGLSRYAGVAELSWQAALACYRIGWNEQAVNWAHMSIAVGRYNGCCAPRHGFIHLPALYELPYDVLRFALPTEEARKIAETHWKAAKRSRLNANDDRAIEVLSVSRCPQRWELRPMLRPPSIRKLCDYTKIVDVEPTRKDLEEACVPNYHATNPSVVVHRDELWAVVRMVNYTIEDGKYVSCDADSRIRTVNLLGRLLEDGSSYTLGEMRIMRDLDKSPRRDTTVLGYEDVRPFSIDGKLWASATVQDRNQGCRIALLDINDAGNIESAIVQESKRQVEKNWMPIVGDEIAWLYEIDPTAVWKIDGLQPSKPCELALDHIRGSSHVIPFDDGYICVTHETISMANWGVRRIYLHRFVRLSKDMRVTAVSPSWTFEDRHYGIEFCCGLAHDPRRPERLILGFGVEDRQAKLLIVPKDEVKKMAWISPAGPK